ncbi:MAG: ABC transporter permease [Saprospiraceae bacterium]|nr:ABC transporter permease [Saprospiraceae bacterium]
MLLRLAWRNIWRNPTRSLTVMGAVALGVWAALFMAGFVTGMIDGYTRSALENIWSHVQVHQKDFKTDYEARYFIPEADVLLTAIGSRPEVRGVSARTVAQGMVASGRGTRGIRIVGVDPEAEQGVSNMAASILEGEYLKGERSNELVVSSRLAEKIKLKLRSKVVLTFQDADYEIVSAAFRVVGIFKTSNTPFDDGHVFVTKKDLDPLVFPRWSDSLGLTGAGLPVAHELAVLLQDKSQAFALEAALESDHPGLWIENYRELAPDVAMYESQIAQISMIYLVIVMLALVFGIINTMLMAVLERYRELGMLMAIGMNKPRIFVMIVLETILLGLVAAPVGLLAGFLTVRYFSHQGLNLSRYSESLRAYGMDEIVYFDLMPVVYWQVPVLLVGTALLAAIYPAWKAISLDPATAIRKI